MASETSTICFRVPVRERDLIETVAHFCNQSVSEFAREILLTEANRVLQKEGADALIEKEREFNQRRLQEAARKAEARVEGLSRRHIG